MIYTIDANVFVGDASVAEVHHTECHMFLAALRKRAEVIYCPTLVLTETVAGIVRPTGNTSLAQSATRLLVRFPGMHLVTLTKVRARRAALIAATYRLRGADSIYVETAIEFGATLITWDAEMLQRAPAAVFAMTPAVWLANPPI